MPVLRWAVVVGIALSWLVFGMATSAVAASDSADTTATGALFTAIGSVLVTLIGGVFGYFKLKGQSARQAELQTQAEKHENAINDMNARRGQELEQLKANLHVLEGTRKEQLADYSRNARLLELMALRLVGSVQRV